jgi:hypothetical protein
MNYKASHIPDRDLLLHLEGELSPGEMKTVSSHIAGCWRCRARRQRIEQAISDFVDLYQVSLNEQLPPADGPRALLKARMAEMASSRVPNRWHFNLKIWSTTFAGIVLLGFVLALPMLTRYGSTRAHNSVVTVPDSRLTPGAALLVSRSAVCTQSVANNKPVPAALQRAVFKEYGISGADPHAYEVDYLITPALGGADDIHNLWPHSYSSTVWNARVKDALETRMREMVCNGSLDLPEAQREIAGNWIAAYKKYFHTDQPRETQ